jgi:hypothetical protein
MKEPVQALVRAYRDSDEQAVIRLWSEVLPNTAPHHDAATSLKQKLAQDPEWILVATIGSQIVGAVMGGFDGHRGWIYSLAVDAAYRRKGIGAGLVRRMEALLRERGCLKLNLQVRSSNSEVAGFYESLGFEVEPNISMGKRLY